jgi:hypothetical protein
MTRKCLNTLGEALDEIFGIFGGGLAGDRLHETKHVPSTMTDITHPQMNVLNMGLQCLFSERPSTNWYGRLPFEHRVPLLRGIQFRCL